MVQMFLHSKTKTERESVNDKKVNTICVETKRLKKKESVNTNNHAHHHHLLLFLHDGVKKECVKEMSVQSIWIQSANPENRKGWNVQREKKKKKQKKRRVNMIC